MAKKVEETSREKKIREICETINKGNFGGKDHDAVTYLGSSDVTSIERFPSGCPDLDDALGGGWPKGRFVELYGAESGGKTTIALQALAQHQKKYIEEEVALVDSEYSLDEEYAKALGVDMRYLIVNQPENGEQALNVISQLIQSGVRLIVVDSVAALTPKSELEGDVGEGSGMAEQARIMSKALRRLTTEAGSRDVTIFWTNQVREKLNVLWGDKTTTPAGHALKHYASIRVKVDRIGTVKEKINGVDVAVCNKTRADVRKNKTSPPFRVAIFYISYGHGIDMEAALLDGALARKVVQKRGAWIIFGDQMLGQGRMATLDLLRKDKELFDKVSKALEEAKAKGVEPEAEPQAAKATFKRPKSPVRPTDTDPDDISSPEAITVESEATTDEPETSVQDA
jgi:recombination protein RecA